MAQAVSCQSLVTEAQIQLQASLCGICGRQSGAGTGFSLNVSVVPSQYDSTNDPYSFICQQGCTTLVVDSIVKQHS
jgi:hypothetical protein